MPAAAQLKPTRDEALEVVQLLEAQGYRPDPEDSPFLSRQAHRVAMNEVLTSSPTIIHYTGHGEVWEEEENLVLWAEPQLCKRYGDCHAGFGRKELADLKAMLSFAEPDREKLLPSGPLVVLNSCLTGLTRAFGGQREDLASMLLEEGAEAVIASPTSVFERMGVRLRTLLYRPDLLAETAAMGEAFLRVRREIEEGYRGSRIWPAWSLLTYHGNPYARLPHES